MIIIIIIGVIISEAQRCIGVFVCVQPGAGVHWAKEEENVSAGICEDSECGGGEGCSPGYVLHLNTPSHEHNKPEPEPGLTPVPTMQ